MLCALWNMYAWHENILSKFFVLRNDVWYGNGIWGIYSLWLIDLWKGAIPNDQASKNIIRSIALTE